MSSEKKFLALRLVGPMQSWGFNSLFSHRSTGLMPTKSGIAGLCCAALGLPRGSPEEKAFLDQWAGVDMLAISIPRILDRPGRPSKKLSVRRGRDYHTVGGGYDPQDPLEKGCITVRAEDGKPRASKGQSVAVLTYRQYLMDASFGVILTGEACLLDRISKAVQNPVWGLWLGRKACIPSSPVHAGLHNSRDKALAALIGDAPLDSFTRQEEVASFQEGGDSLPDHPLSFASAKRVFAPRRVRLIPAKTS